jgi:hypothetical protein
MFKILQMLSSSRKIRVPQRALYVPPHCTWIFILITNTSTIDQYLVWEDFVDFYHFIDSCEELEMHIVKTYLDLTYFLQS